MKFLVQTADTSIQSSQKVILQFSSKFLQFRKRCKNKVVSNVYIISQLFVYICGYSFLLVEDTEM